MRTLFQRWGAAALLMAALGGAASADTVRVGVVVAQTGPLAVMGEQWRIGLEAYVAAHGTRAGDHEIELVYRDSAGNAAMARQMVQELIVREGVQAIFGFGTTPEAAAAAPIINQARTPTFLVHVASPPLLQASPYFIRIGQNIATNATVAAEWALRQGQRTAYIAVADYAPGHDVADAFRAVFEAGGGTVLNQDNIPLNTVDFAPFAERIANAHPDMVQIFIPPGAQAVSMVKAMAARGVLHSSLVIGQGEAEDSDLHLYDGSVENFHSVIFYTMDGDSPEQMTFLNAARATFGADVMPTSLSVGAYDAMDLLYRSVAEMSGDRLDGDRVVESLSGYAWTSPRGPVRIDPQTREVVQDFFVRQVQTVDGALRNVIIETIPEVVPAAGHD